MKCVIVLLVALVGAAVSEFQYTEEWEAWKKENDRIYESKEIETRRHIIWEDNMEFVKNHNARADEHGFTVGMNKFADLELSEFISMYTGTTEPDEDPEVEVLNAPENPDIPSRVDWRARGYVTPVKHQRGCGSCYSFSAIAALESAYGIKHNRRGGFIPDLSEQQVVDCSGSFGNLGCNGGWPYKVYRYLMQTGSESESSYPYTARKGTCKYNRCKVVVHTKKYYGVQKSERSLEYVVASRGPVSVCVVVTRAFHLYRGGVFNDPSCNSQPVNHAVAVVGYGGTRGNEYYIVKNSWGSGWGVNGYIYMSRNRGNQCHIASYGYIPVAA